MITQTFMFQPDLPDTFITFLANELKRLYIGIQDVEVQIFDSHIAVTITGSDINGMCQAAFSLGQEKILLKKA